MSFLKLKSLTVVMFYLFTCSLTAQVLDGDGRSPIDLKHPDFLKNLKYDTTYSLQDSLTIPDGYTAGPGQISKDGLSYYVSLRNDYDSEIFFASRPSTEDEFGTPVLLEGNINSPNLRESQASITVDNLTLVYVRSAQNLWTSNQLYITSRENTSAPFDSGRALSEINTPGVADAYPFITSDGLKLYFTKGTNAKNTLMVSSRISLTDTFLTPTTLPLKPAGDPRSLWLSENEFELYYTDSSLYYASRSSLQDSFGTSLRVQNMSDFGYIASPSLLLNQLYIYSIGSSKEIFIFSGEPVITHISRGKNVPSVYQLSQNFPNPFNPSTKITYSVLKAGLINIDVHDIAGRKVKNLVNKIQQPGFYSINFFPQNLNSGIYFYSLSVNGVIIKTKKMIYIK